MSLIPFRAWMNFRIPVSRRHAEVMKTGMSIDRWVLLQSDRSCAECDKLNEMQREAARMAYSAQRMAPGGSNHGFKFAARF
mmetsp:Transcript_53297/g.80859  ORF Transcript_53297/g.80859 Transcript_53297/m.80859 type:complete len:81 (-) Transcript_53297:581-823(-)